MCCRLSRVGVFFNVICLKNTKTTWYGQLVGYNLGRLMNSGGSNPTLASCGVLNKHQFPTWDNQTLTDFISRHLLTKTFLDLSEGLKVAVYDTSFQTQTWRNDSLITTARLNHSLMVGIWCLWYSLLYFFFFRCINHAAAVVSHDDGKYVYLSPCQKFTWEIKLWVSRWSSKCETTAG